MLLAYIEAAPDIAQSTEWMGYIDTLLNIIGNSFTVITSIFIVILTCVIAYANHNMNKRDERERTEKVKAERAEKLLNISNYLIQNRDFFENIEYPIFDLSMSYKCVTYFNLDTSNRSYPNEFTRYSYVMVQSVDNHNDILCFGYIGHSQVEPASIEIMTEPKSDSEPDTWDKLFDGLKSALNLTITTSLSFNAAKPYEKGVDEISGDLENTEKKRGHAEMSTKEDRKIINAILNMNVDKVKKKVGKISHIDARDSSGRTFLHYAASIAYTQLGYYKRALTIDAKRTEKTRYLSKLMKDHDEIISILINRGANINARDNLGEPVLYAAAKFGNYRAIDLLLMEGARVNMVAKHNRNTALHIAVHSGWETAVEKLIKHRSDLNCKNSEGETPLHYASQLGQLRVARMLLENGSTINERNNDGETPLHKASHTGSPRAIEILLDWGARINDTDSGGETPLHKTSSAGSPKAIETLLDRGAQVNDANSSGETPLHKASSADSPRAIETLLDRGARVNDANSSGETPLHKASSAGSPRAIETLLDRGAGVNDTDSSGETPLHKASYTGSLQAISILVNNGAGVNDINSKGETPLHIVIRNSELSTALSIVDFLIENGASVSRRDSTGTRPHELILKLIFYRRRFAKKV